MRGSTSKPPKPGTARAALGYRSFRIIWLGLFASSIGTWMQNLALPAYIDDRTHQATWVAIMGFAQLGPLLLLSIPGGVLGDKFPRRPWLITNQALQLALEGCVRSHQQLIPFPLSGQLPTSAGSNLSLCL